MFCVKRRSARAQIGAGTKRFSLTRDDDRAHRIVRVGGIKCLDQFLHHLVRERVHALRPMQRDCRDIVANLVAYGGIAHVAAALIFDNPYISIYYNVYFNNNLDMKPSVIFDLGGVVLRWNPDDIIRNFCSDEALRSVIRREVFKHPDWLEMDRGKYGFHR